MNLFVSSGGSGEFTTTTIPINRAVNDGLYVAWKSQNPEGSVVINYRTIETGANP